MLYVKKITVPANTPKENPYRVDVNIYEKYLTRIGVFFPPGPMLLVGVSVWYGETQIFPHREGDWVVGDFQFIQSRVEFEAPEKPCRLRILCYNEDDTYDHTVVVYLYTTNISTREMMNQLIKAIESLGLTQRSIFGFRRWRWW